MKTDVILPMTDECMQQIVLREKTYEFRRYRIKDSVKRVWFYLKAPLSHVSYVCEIDPARTRRPGDPPLPEDGIGNRRFNERHPDMDRCDFAYRIRSVHQLRSPVSLEMLKKTYGVKIAPRGMLYTPVKLLEDVPWLSQNLLWSDVEDRIPMQVVHTDGNADLPSVSKVPSAKSAKKHAVPIEPDEPRRPSKRQRWQSDTGS